MARWWPDQKGYHCNCTLINILDRWIRFSFEYFSTSRWDSVHHFWLFIENPSLSLYFQAGWTEKPITKPQFLADFDGSSRFGLSRVLTTMSMLLYISLSITLVYFFLVKIPNGESILVSQKNSRSVPNAYLTNVGVFTINVQSKSCKRLNSKFWWFGVCWRYL